MEQYKSRHFTFSPQQQNDEFANLDLNSRSQSVSRISMQPKLDLKQYTRREDTPPLDDPDSDKERDISSSQVIVSERQSQDKKSTPLKWSPNSNGLYNQEDKISENMPNSCAFLPKSKQLVKALSKAKKSQYFKNVSNADNQEELPPINEEFKIKMENFKIERFFYMWMDLIEGIRLKKLNQYQIKRISDKSAHHIQQTEHTIDHIDRRKSMFISQPLAQNKYTWKKMQKLFLKKIVKFLNKIWWNKVISPFNPLSIFIDVITIIIITIDVMMITWRTFYGLQLDIIAFEFFSFSHFLIFIISRFHIGFYDEGKICLEKKKIMRRYLKESFLLDFIGVNSMAIYLITNNHYVRLINFARIGALRESFNKIEYLLYNYGIASHSYHLFKLVLNIMIISHFLGVAYHILNLIEVEFGEEQSWLQVNGFDQQPWIYQYAESLYWAVSTLMLIGAKGDTLAETIFTTSVLFITVGIFGYLISSISEIIDDINKKQKQYNKDFRIINRYMRNKGISSKIQAEVRSAIESQYNSKELLEDNSEAQQIINNLPEKVREEIRLQINMEILDRFPVFKRAFTPNFLSKVSTIMEEKTFVENETIFNVDTDQTYMWKIDLISVELIYYLNQVLAQKAKIFFYIYILLLAVV